MSAQKKYNPARVVDPSTPHHLIKLYPNQELDVVLSNDFKKKFVQISVDSLFFDSCTNQKEKDGSYVMRFKPKFDLVSWSKVSKVFLGEIIIEYKGDGSGSKHECSLCLVMDIVNPVLSPDEYPTFSRMLTVVNPRNNYVKTAPENILEIILFSPRLRKKDELEAFVTKGGEGSISYQIIAHRTIDILSHFSSKRHAIRGQISTKFGMPCVEHHYFLKLSEESLEYVNTLNKGVHPAGKLTFSVKKSNGIPFTLHVLLHVTHKQEKVKKPQIDPVYKLPTVYKPKQADWKRQYDEEYDAEMEAAWESNWMNNGKPRKFESTYGSYCEVDLKIIESESLEAGCIVVYSKKNVLIYG